MKEQLLHTLKLKQLRKITSFLLVIVGVMLFSGASAQVLTNYAVTRVNTGSFTNITSLSPSSAITTATTSAGLGDDVASAVLDVGFDFYFMGRRYNKWSCNSNGQIALGDTNISAATELFNGSGNGNTTFNLYGNGPGYQLGYPIIAALGGDNCLVSNGTAYVKYAVSGTAPNRKLIIEYNGFALDFDVSTFTNTTKFQVQLEETTSKIVFVFGNLINRSGNSDLYSFLGSGSTQRLIYSTGTNITATSNTVAQTAFMNPASGTNLQLAGGITDGTRSAITFNPNTTALAAPTLGTVTSTTSSITVNWTNVTGNTGYRIYYSTVSATTGTPYIAANSSTSGRIDVATNAVTATIPNLGEAGTYYISVYTKREGISASSPTTKTLSALAYSVSSVTVTQAGSGILLAGATNVPVLRIAVGVTGNSGTLPLTSIALTFPTLSPVISSSNFNGLKVYKTSTTTFSTQNQLGTGSVTVGASGVTITTSNAGAGLATNFTYGTTYLWIAMDVSASAAGGATLDLQIPANGININGSTTNPTTLQNPSGNYYTSSTAPYDFESGMGTWVSPTGQSSQWTANTMPYGVLSGSALGAALLPGNGAYGVPTKVLGTNFAAAYGSYINYNVVSPVFTAVGNTEFTFSILHDLNPIADAATLEYSTNAGSTWTLVATYSGSSNGWQSKTYSVTSTAGQYVKFRFTLNSSDGLFGGVFLDNFGINCTEFIDNTAPSVAINTAIANPIFRGNLTATSLVNITDGGSGVDGTVNKPRLYYKKSTSNNDSASWQYVIASNTASPFSFNVDVSKIDGLDAGDIVQYFVMAQDVASIPNAGSLTNVTFSSSVTSVTLKSANFPVTGTGIRTFTVQTDNTAPAITIGTPIANNTSITTIALASFVTVTDAGGTGVQRNLSNDNRPRLYYKKSTDANNLASWKYVQATSGVSPFSFTLDLTKLNNSPAGGDVIQYFVVAMDSASSPNVALSSGLTFGLVPGTVSLQAGNFPINGTIPSFTITSVAKTLSSVTVAQSSVTAAVRNSTNVPILRLALVVAGNSGTLNLNSLTVNLAGTSTSTDVSRVRLHVGSTTNFSSATAIGANAQTFSSGVVTFNTANSGTGVPYNIPLGTSYLWITYDVAATATIGATLDANIAINGITIGSSTYPATLQNPTGVTTIFNTLFSYETGSSSFFNLGTGNGFTTGTMPSSDLSYGTTTPSPSGVRTDATGTTVLGMTFSNGYDYCNTYTTYSPDFAATGSTNINYNSWYNLYSGFDNLYVHYTTNGGTSWVSLENAITGSSGGWLSKSFSVATTNGQTIRFRFQMIGGCFDQGQGWWIDDFACNMAISSGDVTPPVATVNTVVPNQFVSNTGTLAIRNLCSFTDAGVGVDTVTNGKNMLYIKKSTGANDFTSSGGWTRVAALRCKTGDWDVSGSIFPNGYNVGDVFQYFAVAQDKALPANVGTFSNVSFGSTPTSSTLSNSQSPVTGTGIKTFTIIDETVAPVISYTAIAGNSTITTYTHTATITDAGRGVNNTTNLPRLYYKKSTDANTSAGWKFVTATNTTSPYSFPINLTAISAAGGNTIQYFVIAQDFAGTPNVAATTGITFSSAPSSVALQSGNFPIGGTIQSYTISTVTYAFSTLSVTNISTGSVIGTVAPVGLKQTVPLAQIAVTITGNSGTLPTISALVVGRTANVAASSNMLIRLYRSTSATFDTVTAVRMGTGSISANTSNIITAANSTTSFGMPYSLPVGTTYFYVTATAASNCVLGTTQSVTISSFSTGITIGGTARTTGTANVVSTSARAAIFNDFESTTGGFTSSLETVLSDLTGTGTGPAAKWNRATMATGDLNGDPFYYSGSTLPGARTGAYGSTVWGSTDGVNAPSVATGTANSYTLYSPLYATVSAVTANFSYWEYMDGDGGFSSNFYTVYASVDNGANWSLVYSPTNYSSWSFVNFSVAMLANSTLQLRFVQSVDNYYQYNGSYIDDFYSTVNVATSVDVTAPTVTLNTAISNGAVQVLRSVVAVAAVADASPSSGINTTAGSAPRLYYKKSTDANTSANWKYVEATNATSPFNFNVNYALLTTGSVAVGDIIQYFVVAADNAGKVGLLSGITAPSAASVTSINLSSANLTNVAGFQTFTISSSAVALANVLVSHPSTKASINATNQLLKVELQVSGNTGTLSLTSLQVKGVANNFTSSLGTVKLYSTGTTNSFTSPTLLGSGTLSGFGANASLTFSGLSLSLPINSTYLWLTMDVPATAVSGNTIDLTIAANGISVFNGTTTSTALPASLLTASGTVTLGYPDLGFDVTRTTSNTFTPINGTSGAVSFASNSVGTDEGQSNDVSMSAIGFTGFIYQGLTVTSFTLSPNGAMTLNATAPTIDFQNTSVNSLYIMPLYDDLICSSTEVDNHFSYKVTGTTGSKVLTVEWLNMTQFANTTADINMQVKFYQSDNHIEFVYGNMVGFTGNGDYGYSYSCGLTGASNTISMPLGQSYIQKYANTINFRNEATDNLTAMPACNSMLSFVPNASASFNSNTPSTPTNVSIATATTLSLGSGLVPNFCVTYQSTAAGAQADNGSIVALSGTTADDGAWFKFVNDASQDINVYITASGGFQPVVQIMNGTSPYATLQSLAIDEGSKGTLTATLAAGTYYVRVYHSGTGIFNTSFNQGTPSSLFNILVYKTATPPANDNCSGAIAFTANGTENLFTSLNATAGSDVPSAASGSGANPADDDVWYTLTSSASTVALSFRGVGVFNPVVEVWKSGCPTAASSTNNRISDGGGNGVAITTLNIANPISGSSTYYIRVYDYSTGALASGTSQFYLSATIPVTPCPTILTGIANGATNVANDQAVVYTWTPLTGYGTVTYSTYLGTLSNPTDDLFTSQSGTTFSGLPTPGVLNYFIVKAVSATNGTSTGCSSRSFRVLARPTTSSFAYFRTSSNYSPLSALFNSSSVWEASNDSITWIAASIPPTGLSKSILVNSGATITISASDTVKNMILSNGATMIINSGQQLLIAPDATNASRREFIVNGTITSLGSIVPISGTNTADMVIGSSGVFEYNATAPGALPLATWSNGSTLKFKGLTSGTGTFTNANQVFSNVSMELPSSNSSTINLGSAIDTVSGNLTIASTGNTGKIIWSDSDNKKTRIAGNLTLTSGTLELNNSNSKDTIQVGGNLVLTKGAITATAGSTAIRVKGNVTVADSITLPTANNVFELYGTSPTSLTLGSKGTRFAKLKVNKTGSSAANRDIASSGKITISDSLHFVSGTITTGTTDTVFLNTSGKLAGETSGNKLIGTVKANTTLGTSATGTFGNIGATITCYGAAPGAISVTRNNSTAYTNANNSRSIKRSYDISPAVDTLLDATLVFKYFADELNGFSASSLCLARSTNSGISWIPVRTGLVNDVNNYTITKTGITAFSTWTATDNVNTLPVTLLDFAGIIKGSSINFTWRTATELNNKGFALETSTDGKTYNETAWINGNGNSNTVKSYHHSLPYSQPSYYRLRQVDFNGKTEYSQAIFVSQKQARASMKVSPIPITDLSEITFSEVDGVSPVSITLLSSHGLIINQYQGTTQQATEWLRALQGNLVSGMYLLNAQVGSQTLKIKLVK